MINDFERKRMFNSAKCFIEINKYKTIFRYKMSVVNLIRYSFPI